MTAASRLLSASAFIAAAITVGSPARADKPAAAPGPSTSASAPAARPAAGTSCADAYTSAQVLRNARKLIEARDALRICAQPACKDFIVKDCSEWLDDVQGRLPRVVPVATDDQGTPLSGVKVAVDHAPLLDAIDGRSVEVDPGAHVFTFEAQDGTKVESSIIVSEGDHAQRVAVVFHGASTGSPAAGGAGAASSGGAGAAATASPDAPTRSAGPWRTVGLVTAGVGAAGLVAGVVFGLDASSKKSQAGCDSQSVCPTQSAADTLRDAQSAGSVATVFFIAGGVLAAGGVALWALAPRAPVQVTPAVGREGAGLSLVGKW